LAQGDRSGAGIGTGGGARRLIVSCADVSELPQIARAPEALAAAARRRKNATRISKGIVGAPLVADLPRQIASCSAFDGRRSCGAAIRHAGTATPLQARDNREKRSKPVNCRYRHSKNVMAFVS
jgi:hypothetical protein